LHDETKVAEHGVEELFRIHLGLDLIAHQRALPFRFAGWFTFSSLGNGWFLF
jgi:hypothetical protein